MSTRQIIAAAASVAILGSTLAIFQTSSHPRDYSATSSNGAMVEARTVRTLAPVVVQATPLPRDAAGMLAAPTAHARSGFALPSLDNTSLKTGSPLFMPYYSFANDLHTIIKE